MICASLLHNGILPGFEEQKMNSNRPNIIIFVKGGMVQSVKCNIAGATAEVFDADTDEWIEENEEQAYTAISALPE